MPTAQRRAILVSHGQPSDPAVAEAEIAALARQVATHAPGWDIRGATLAAPGALEAALDDAPDNVPVYPLFMADGWFTRRALPDRLSGRGARQLAPFGLDPALPDFAADWLTREIDAAGWRVEECELLLAAHGSGRSARPALVTCAFAEALRARLPLSAIRCGFVEEAPRLAEAAARMGARAFCLPFFAARRGHVLDDLPEALDAANFAGARLGPIGCHPEIPAFIAARLAAG